MHSLPPFHTSCIYMHVCVAARVSRPKDVRHLACMCEQGLCVHRHWMCAHGCRGQGHRGCMRVSPPAPAPVKRTTGGMGKSWEPAPHSDYQFCQYISPSIAHDSGPCNYMSSPFPFGPFHWRACDVSLHMRVLDTSTPFHMTCCKTRGWSHYDIILGLS